MYSVASEVLKDNGFGCDHWRPRPVRLLPIHSEDIVVVECDLGAGECRIANASSNSDVEAENSVDGRFDLIVTETLDCGVFGEGIVSTLHGAWTKLLRTREEEEEEEEEEMEDNQKKKSKTNEMDSGARNGSETETRKAKSLSLPRVIPAAVKIFVRGFESPSFRQKIICRYDSMADGEGVSKPLTFLAKNAVVSQ